jgi:hypothetical protein
MAATLAVLELAVKIESSILSAAAWYREVPIAELDYLTARQLVAQGDAETVIRFLRAIRNGDRD